MYFCSCLHQEQGKGSQLLTSKKLSSKFHRRSMTSVTVLSLKHL